MAEVDRALCRRTAAECIGLARLTTDIDAKEALLNRGQEWLKLAYSDHDDEFERLLGEFNTQQLGVEHAAAHPAQCGSMQQARSEREGEG
jgi:hypothetical protein